jgi:WD40 repeat protein
LELKKEIPKSTTPKTTTPKVAVPPKKEPAKTTTTTPNKSLKVTTDNPYRRGIENVAKELKAKLRWDAKLKVWNLAGENTHALDAHWFTIHAVKSNPAMSFLATASMDKTIRLWNAHDFSLLKVIDNVKFEGHKSSVNGCVWLSDTMFVTCSDDRSIKCWQINEAHKI